MPRDELEELIRSLKSSSYTIESERSTRYNCIAWALYDTGQYWDPVMVPVKGYYWPPGVNKNDKLASWMGVFAFPGYQPCPTGAVEDGFEKIAIYGKSDGTASHVARQLESGLWASKLGKLEDIHHDTVNALEGNYDSVDNDSDYGVVVQYMRRKRHVSS